jgi:transcriptional regulator with XRE-family HTH domain
MSPRLRTVLKRLRETRGLTQVQLATRARISQSYLAELERGGKTSPSLAVLRRLARALNIPPSALLD